MTVVVIDSDDWVCMRAAELRSKGEACQIGVLIEGGRVHDCFVVRSNGTVERAKKARVIPAGWEAYCAPVKEKSEVP